jgi:hypothetical protein
MMIYRGRAEARPWQSSKPGRTITVCELGGQELPLSAHQTERSQGGFKRFMSVIADLLQQKVGLSPDQAQQAEQVVVEHLTSRVPPEFQGVLASVLGTGTGADGSQPAAGDSGGMSGLLGEATKLFGG